VLELDPYINQVVLGDCVETLKSMPSCSVDLVVTDPPYGYSFMGKDWDKSVPSVEVWKECLRVLKPGAFAFVMSAPRQDVLSEMIVRLTAAGFNTSFTSLYWTYASGFPKASNIGKAVDRRNGCKRAGVIAKGAHTGTTFKSLRSFFETGKPISREAKAFEGSYAGYQPKPAVEVILIAMKPLAEDTYVDQALANGHGITWLDDCRIPFETKVGWSGSPSPYWGTRKGKPSRKHARFPANLLVSDDVLSRGDHRGSYSRYFDLDKWADTLPFLICPKPSKSERNKGCCDLRQRKKWLSGGGGTGILARRTVVARNNHPTVKPLKLMYYLITMGSRPGHVVLDPFCGSGSTGVAALNLDRNFIGCELSAEYKRIADARISDALKVN
jgi:DNA modification methylase